MESGVSTGAQISDRTGFVLSADSPEASVASTDNSWEVEEDKGVQFLPTPPEIQRSYFVAEPAERIDGGSFDWSWNDTASSAANGRRRLRLEMPSREDRSCRITTGN